MAVRQTRVVLLLVLRRGFVVILVVVRKERDCRALSDIDGRVLSLSGLDKGEKSYS